VGLPDDVETLFQPFHTTKEGGLGMGLSICRTLVTSHGGRLWAERRAEGGAAFYIALPLAKDDGVIDAATIGIDDQPYGVFLDSHRGVTAPRVTQPIVASDVTEARR
jgi:hypothetical protein